MIQAPSSRTTPAPLTRALLVDDDAQILAGLRRQLRSGYRTVATTSPHEALELAASAANSDDGPFAVVVSDLKMPGMDGLSLLDEMRRSTPSTVRVLLTGFAELETAIEAVNRGSVFRFLCKPCPATDMRTAVDAAAEHHRLLTSERELLELTLNGSIEALLQTLALANPPAFSRAVRLRTLVTELLDELGIVDRWHIEVATMLSQLGAVTLPPALVDKLHRGAPLTREEDLLCAELPQLALQLLAGIPRLDDVRTIISGLSNRDRVAEDLPSGTRIIAVALAFDVLEASGHTASESTESMRSRIPLLDESLVETICALKGSGGVTRDAAEVAVGELRSGMILGTDLTTVDGVLLVGRGSEVSESLLARVRNFGDRVDLAELVPVRVPGSTAV